MGQQSRWLPLNSQVEVSGFLDIKDITDTLAKRFVDANDPRVQNWLDIVDGELLVVAQQVDANLNSILVPLHPTIWKLAKKFFYIACFEDTWGSNNNIQSDKETIFLKLNQYKKDVEALKLECTYEMFSFTNQSLVAQQTAGGTMSLLRG